MARAPRASSRPRSTAPLRPAFRSARGATSASRSDAAPPRCAEALRAWTGCTSGFLRCLADRRIRLHDLFRGTLDVLDRARDEVTAFTCKIQRFADAGLARVRNDRAVQEKLEPAVHASPEREVPVQKISGAPIAHGDAEAVAEVVLGFLGAVDAVVAAIRPAVRALLGGLHALDVAKGRRARPTFALMEVAT